MTNDEAQELAGANSVSALSVVLDSLSARPTNFVVATSEHVFVGGDAEAAIDGVTYRNTSDGSFTRHALVPQPVKRVEEAGEAAIPQRVAPPSPAQPAPVEKEAAVKPRPPGISAPVSPDHVVSPSQEPVLVRGLMCQRDHLVHPEARMCPLCGDNMQNRSLYVSADGSVGDLGPRPPLGIVILPDGRSYQLSRNMVLGRAPEMHPEVQAGTADAIMLPDSELSRAHLRFVLNDWNVAVEDLGSTNGSWIGTGPQARQLEPNSPVALRSGIDIAAGTSVINYQPTSAAVT